MVELPKIANFIDGFPIAPKNGEYLENFEPATGKAYALVPNSTAADVELAVAAAKAIQPWWQARTNEQRAEVLLSIADKLAHYADELVHTLSRDLGLPLAVAREFEIPRTIQNFRYYGTKILYTENKSTFSGPLEATSYTHHNALGISAIVGPASAGLSLLTEKIAAALAVGNTVVCKPSEFASLPLFQLGEYFNEAGLPHGVVNFIFGKDASALVNHPAIPLVSFVGSKKSAEKIFSPATWLNKKVQLDLETRNISVVTKEADLAEAAIQSVRASFQNPRGTSEAITEIYVAESVFADFVARVTRYTSLQRVGMPEARESILGPLLSASKQKRAREFVEKAKRSGAKLTIGAETPHAPGYFFTPAVFTDLPLDLAAELLPGAMLAIFPYTAEKELLQARGIHSVSLWCQEIKKAHTLAQSFSAKNVYVNSGHMYQQYSDAERNLDFFRATQTIWVKH